MSQSDTTVEAMSKVVEPATRQNRRRRWIQFSLRGALLCVLVVAIALSWFAARLEYGREQRAAVLAIEGTGGWVSYDNDGQKVPGALNRWARQALGDDFFDYVTQVRFQGADKKRWTPEEFRKFGRNGTAEQLSKWQPWTRENVLALKPHLENLTRLESLSFYRTVIPRHGLEAVSGLRNLRYLGLEKSQITSVDLQYLSGLENLEILTLRRTRIRDDGLVHLKGLTRLKPLHLGSTAIGDAGLKHLAGLTVLETLNLENTKITDDGIAYLRTLTNLKSLHLGLTDVSDESIGHLACFMRLKTLVVGDAVTSDGIASLQRALPACEVRWSTYRGRRR